MHRIRFLRYFKLTWSKLIESISQRLGVPRFLKTLSTSSETQLVLSRTPDLQKSSVMLGLSRTLKGSMTNVTNERTHRTCRCLPLLWTFNHFQPSASPAVRILSFDWNSSAGGPQWPCSLHRRWKSVSPCSPGSQCGFRHRRSSYSPVSACQPVLHCIYCSQLV